MRAAGSAPLYWLRRPQPQTRNRKVSYDPVREGWGQVNFSKVLLDVMTIADEVDSQLKQAMLSYAEPTTPSWLAA